jgi:methanogenic corrinoid protein MtbC1
MHEIGIMASALLCVHHGVKFIFLGANLPAKSLAEASNALHPKAILLGVTKGHEISDHKTLEEYLTEVTNHLTSKSEIMVGGNLRAYAKTELEKRNIRFFSSLEAFDEFLTNF